MEKYPEELTPDEFDNISWDLVRQFAPHPKKSNNMVEREVRLYASETGGQVYTQVDGDNDIVYSRGFRFVNRTGIWEVVKKAEWIVDNS